ncbi:MAG TPA: hypothetical protein VGO06_27860 [Bosea sp. (in: a-proteobacteria)]|jgi:hypothetical protein|uniref:hypothetical protein n=1 Tax=Bosea sp. (in: a-proteobacteria) TaxID=1871050 RepID=UPI002E1309C1|nr:hypothetical protein [Bosea sp. (in: a-proteobacteria)]
MARQFAHRLADVRCIRQLGPAGDATEDNAEAVNYYIGMIADEADALITALIEDAEACGMKGTGPWMKIPLVEYRKFEVIERDPDLERADDDQDEKLNS